MLSAMVHGGGSVETAVRVALAATSAVHGLDRDRFMLYFDLIYRALSRTAKEAFRMDSQGTRFFSEEFQQSFDRGRAAEKATDVLDVLEARGLSVSEKQRERIVSCADLVTLTQWLRRAATVDSMDALFQ